jgi:UDP-N-acetyl-D-glucosamine dehydrogenase
MEVIGAAKTKVWFHAVYPGLGVGGHCIPIDPFYLTWKAREYSQHTRLIELAGEINRRMPSTLCTRSRMHSTPNANLSNAPNSDSRPGL